MRMRSQPKEPVRETITRKVEIYNNTTLAEIAEYFKGIPHDQIKFLSDVCEEYGDIEEFFFFTCTREETDEEMEVKREKYAKALEKYVDWCIENKEEIEAEKKKKALAKETKKEKDAVRVKKQIEKLQKELKRLEK
jgi:ABC-type nitrate/sulfonate/bicarbonate transport system substrate-binding protein